MKISVSSYSFMGHIIDGRMHQFDCVQKAKEMGFDAIEFITLTPFEGMTQKEYAQKLRDKADEVGIEISSYTINADLLNGSDGDHKKEIDMIKEQVEIAAILKAPVMRHDITVGYPPEKYQAFDNVVDFLAECCDEISEYAKTLGVKTMVENHGLFAQDSQRIEKLKSKVKSDNFGLLLDMGNFLCVDEAPNVAFGRLAPYAFYVHAKDFFVKTDLEQDPGRGYFASRGGNMLKGAIIGHGDVPVIKCLQALKRAGYTGDIAVEFEGLEDSVLAIEIGLENLKKYIKLAGF